MIIKKNLCIVVVEEKFQQVSHSLSFVMTRWSVQHNSDEKKKSLKERKELKMTGLCSVMKKRASIGHGMMEDGSRKTNCLEDGLQ